MTEQELFERIGRALVPGRAWPAGLAELMGVRPDTVRHWRTGRLDLRPDHFETLLTLVVAQREELTKAEQELRIWLAEHPEED
jgi:hypothetical protein